MKSELVGLDLLLLTSFFDELLGQLGAFARSHHPADDITTENVEDHVEVKIGPLGRAAKLGDVPAPKLIGGAGQKFRFLILGMDELIAALASCAIFFQHTIHGPSRAKILAFIEQRGVDRGGEQSWKRSQFSTARTDSRSLRLRARAGIGRAAGAENETHRAGPSSGRCR